MEKVSNLSTPVAVIHRYSLAFNKILLAKCAFVTLCGKKRIVFGKAHAVAFPQTGTQPVPSLVFPRFLTIPAVLRVALQSFREILSLFHIRAVLAI